MELVQQATPFDHPDWLFEPKHDGFRALAYIQGDNCKLVSRNDANYTRFRDLARVLPGDLNAKNAILDGELVVLDQTGKSQFYELMANHGTVVFAVFDLLWLNGKDRKTYATNRWLSGRNCSGSACVTPLIGCCSWTMSRARARRCIRESTNAIWKESYVSQRSARIEPSAARRRGSR